ALRERLNLGRWWLGPLVWPAHLPFEPSTRRTLARDSSGRKPKATTKDTKEHEGTRKQTRSQCLFCQTCSFSGFLLRRAGSPLRRMYQPRDPDAEHIQRHHGCGENAHVEDIGRGRKDGCDDKDHENRITQIAPHPARGYHSHQRKKEHQDRKLKDRA